MYKYKYSFFTELSIRFSKYIGIKSNLISTFLLFGLPFSILFSIILYVSRNLVNTYPLIFLFYSIGGFWLFLGPILIVKWEKTFCKFQIDVKRKIKVNKAAKLTFVNRVYFNDKYRYFASFVFSFLFFIIIFSGVDAYKQLGINHGYNDLFFWLLLIIASQIGFTAGFGFWGVFKTIHTILILCRYYSIDLKIFNADRLGGLAFIYKFILSTTYAFSLGSLMIPFWLQIVFSSVTGLKVISYILITFYSISIASSFFIPSYYVSKTIKAKINKTLHELSLKLNHLIHQSDDSFEFLKLFNTYKYLSEYDLVPLDSKKVIKFSISVLAPIIIAVLNALLSNYFK